MRLAQLLGPHAHERLVGSLGRRVDGLACNAQTGAGRGDEDDASPLGQVGLGGLGQEDGALDVGVEVPRVELLGGVDEVGLVALCSADRL